MQHYKSLRAADLHAPPWLTRADIHQ